MIQGLARYIIRLAVVFNKIDVVNRATVRSVVYFIN